MPDPKSHDQPAEGGPEAVEHTLQRQSEPKDKRKPASGGGTNQQGKTDEDKQGWPGR